jgi:hypothetical protein
MLIIEFSQGGTMNEQLMLTGMEDDTQKVSVIWTQLSEENRREVEKLFAMLLSRLIREERHDEE